MSPTSVTQKAKKTSDRLNAHLLQQARGSADVQYLASPVTGGGIQVNRFQQLFLLAQSQGHKQPADWAHQTWQLLQAQGQRLIKEGAPIESPEENLAELTQQAEEFAEKRLPILTGVGGGVNVVGVVGLPRQKTLPSALLSRLHLHRMKAKPSPSPDPVAHERRANGAAGRLASP